MANPNDGGNANPSDAGLPLSGGTVTGPVLFPDGSAAAPAMSFASDTDTGVYLVSANTGGLVRGGVLQWQWGSGGFGAVGAGSQVNITTAGAATGTPNYSWEGANSTSGLGLNTTSKAVELISQTVVALAADTTIVTIAGATLQLSTQRTITNSTDAGTTGEICADDTYLYYRGTARWFRVTWEVAAWP